MKGARLLAAALLGGVLALSNSGHALAWEPEGVIKKYVQNQTTNSARADANEASEAINAKPGDILKYTIEIHNNGATDNGAENDMHGTRMTDTLPAGTELVSNPSQRVISEDIGVVPAGESITKEYIVRVTATTDKDLLDNKACFTGDSEPEDNPQQGCDTAKVVVSNPPKEEPKTEGPKPEQPPSKIADNNKQQPPKEQPQALPKTGDTTPAPMILGASVLGYFGHLIHSKRRR